MRHGMGLFNSINIKESFKFLIIFFKWELNFFDRVNGNIGKRDAKSWFKGMWNEVKTLRTKVFFFFRNSYIYMKCIHIVQIYRKRTSCYWLICILFFDIRIILNLSGKKEKKVIWTCHNREWFNHIKWQKADGNVTIWRSDDRLTDGKKLTLNR